MFKEIADLLATIRSEYEKNRFVFIEGTKMKEILRFFGASEADLFLIEQSGNSLSDDPTLPFRKSSNGRFLIDLANNKASRLKFQSFILSEEEGFKREDADKYRNFRGIQDTVQNNTAFQALIKFQAYMFNGMKIKNLPNLEESNEKWVSTVFQLRTITTPEFIGEPAKEGVHHDGVEHIMTTLLYTKNISSDSAVSQVHSTNQETGARWDMVTPEFVIGRSQHKNFLDTLLIVDSELKHSVSPVNAFNPEKEAFRDIVLFCTRRPKSESHKSYGLDSLEPHDELPTTFLL